MSNLSSLRRNTICLMNFPNPQHEEEGRSRQVVLRDKISGFVFQEVQEVLQELEEAPLT